jgi:hypothetical protein
VTLPLDQQCQRPRQASISNFPQVWKTISKRKAEIGKMASKKKKIGFKVLCHLKNFEQKTVDCDNQKMYLMKQLTLSQ